MTGPRRQRRDAGRAARRAAVAGATAEHVIASVRPLVEELAGRLAAELAPQELTRAARLAVAPRKRLGPAAAAARARALLELVGVPPLEITIRLGPGPRRPLSPLPTVTRSH